MALINVFLYRQKVHAYNQGVCSLMHTKNDLLEQMSVSAEMYALQK